MLDGCQHPDSASGVSGQRPLNRFHEGGHARSSCTRTLSFVFDQSCILNRGHRLLGGYGIEWAGWEVSKENLSKLAPFDSEANVVV